MIKIGIYNLTMDTENTLFDDIFNFQSKPSEYTALLFEQAIYEMRLLCAIDSEKPNSSDFEIPLDASSLINEVYVKLLNGHRDTKADSVRVFYKYLTKTIQNVLVDRYRQIVAINKKTKNETKIDSPDRPYSFQLTKGSMNIETLVGDISKISKIEADVGETLSFKYFTNKNIDQISIIMGKPTSTIDLYLSQGKKLLEHVNNKEIIR